MMGSADYDAYLDDGEYPPHEEHVVSFEMASTTTTNAAFRQFVDATQYITDAEREGNSFVFEGLLPTGINTTRGPGNEISLAPWWFLIDGADWQHPEGPQSSIAQRENHPVVHVSWNDAQAYCHWLGCRLPTEIEWEYAARGGLEKQRYPWGNELLQENTHHCNIWQGEFPTVNTEEDGFYGTAPVTAFHPNGYGLYNVSGNVWEWCDSFYAKRPESSTNPIGARVLKGGSYLCHSSYCNRYRIAARYGNDPSSSTGNAGFRCARDIND